LRASLQSYVGYAATTITMKTFALFSAVNDWSSVALLNPLWTSQTCQYLLLLLLLRLFVTRKIPSRRPQMSHR